MRVRRSASLKYDANKDLDKQVRDFLQSNDLPQDVKDRHNKAVDKITKMAEVYPWVMCAAGVGYAPDNEDDEKDPGVRVVMYDGDWENNRRKVLEKFKKEHPEEKFDVEEFLLKLIYTNEVKLLNKLAQSIALGQRDRAKELAGDDSNKLQKLSKNVYEVLADAAKITVEDLVGNDPAYEPDAPTEQRIKDAFMPVVISQTSLTDLMGMLAQSHRMVEVDPKAMEKAISTLTKNAKKAKKESKKEK